jgi:type II secretory pathway pseudopilin PulG
MIDREGEKTMRNQRGFTMLEGAITISLIVVVAAIGVPQFQKMATNSSLKAAARDIMGEFSYLKEKALTGDTTVGSRMYQITLNTSAQTYQIQRCTVGQVSTCPDWATIQIKNFTPFGKDIGFDATHTTATNYVFQTRGTVTIGNGNTTSGSIVLQNNRGSTATITILTAGRIYVQYALK